MQSCNQVPEIPGFSLDQDCSNFTEIISQPQGYISKDSNISRLVHFLLNFSGGANCQRNLKNQDLIGNLR